MPKTNTSYAPRSNKRRVKKYQEIVREAGSLSQVNHELYECDLDGQTLSTIYMDGVFSGVGAIHHAIVLVPVGTSVGTLATADGSVPYTNDNFVLYCGWESGDAYSTKISRKIKAQRKLILGDKIYLLSTATATTNAQYIDVTMFIKQP